MKTAIRRICTPLLIFALAFTLTACGPEPQEEPDPSEPSEEFVAFADGFFADGHFQQTLTTYNQNPKDISSDISEYYDRGDYKGLKAFLYESECSAGYIKSFKIPYPGRFEFTALVCLIMPDSTGVMQEFIYSAQGCCTYDTDTFEIIDAKMNAGNTEWTTINAFTNRASAYSEISTDNKEADFVVMHGYVSQYDPDHIDYIDYGTFTTHYIVSPQAILSNSD